MRFAHLPEEPVTPTIGMVPQQLVISPQEPYRPGHDSSHSSAMSSSEEEQTEEFREKRLKELQDQVCLNFTLITVFLRQPCS